MRAHESLRLWERSASAWIEFMREGDVSREMLDPLVHLACGDVAGKDVLDIGCGEGRFLRQLAARGARVTGVEPVAKLREESARRAPELNVVAGFAEDLPLPDAAFDLALFYLVLLDVEDFRGAIQEAARVLRPGGRLVNVNVTSMRSASEGMWRRDSRGEKIAWQVEFYGEERAVLQEWRGLRTVCYHRPLSSYFKEFLGAGLRLLKFEEPVPSPDFLSTHPDEDDHFLCPNFNVVVWERPQ